MRLQVLLKERDKIDPQPVLNTQDVDNLVMKVLQIQEIRKKIRSLEEEINWEKQNFDSMQGEWNTNACRQGGVSQVQEM